MNGTRICEWQAVLNPSSGQDIDTKKYYTRSRTGGRNATIHYCTHVPPSIRTGPVPIAIPNSKDFPSGRTTPGGIEISDLLGGWPIIAILYAVVCADTQHGSASYHQPPAWERSTTIRCCWYRVYRPSDGGRVRSDREWRHHKLWNQSNSVAVAIVVNFAIAVI